MQELIIDTINPGKVLFVGNGLVKSGGGISWDDLLKSISENNIIEDYKNIPNAMQPELLCGTDVEKIQSKVANIINDSTSNPSLENLLKLPFDAIITTNYTYEIENILCNRKWSEYKRKKSLRFLHGSTHVRHNKFLCNLVKTPDGKQIPVFHIHGEKSRKHSMILSYYSYANAVSRLVAYNKN